ncbi:MAG: YutD family protein [Bacilli bacterium]|nr:YutD family protein [Bacilli bacterium]
MKDIILNNIKYKLITNIRDGYDSDEVKSKATDYFMPFDYIVGDWAYGKLRLKGFYDKNNKSCKSINDIENLEKYIKENCAFNCKYFVLKKYVQK